MHLVTPHYLSPGHGAMKDQLTHFQWLDRDKNEVVTDLIVINDAYLERTLSGEVMQWIFPGIFSDW